MKVYNLSKPGDIANLTINNIELSKINAEDAHIVHEYLTVNHTDLHHIEGALPLPEGTTTPGYAAIGFVHDAGIEVEHLNYNDRVVYATGPYGAYAEERYIHPKHLVNVPEDLNNRDVAAIFSKAMTAHYLLFRTFRVTYKHYVLVQGASGAVGQMLCRWAKHLGAFVIGTVSTEEKAQVAKNCGCDHVVIYTKENYAQEIIDITKNTGVDVVFDMVGQATYESSLYCITAYGMLVLVGSASGNVTNIDPNVLRQRCVFVTCPRLEVYKMRREELILSANEVFNKLRDKVIVPQFYEYKFDQIPQALNDIKSRALAGSPIVKLGE
ncbi:MAG: zinc-binding dehydrogenase [Pseudomonadota bacterium]